MSKLPTKEEIKKAYNISVDFEILTSFPAEEEIKKKNVFLKKLGSVFGVQDWMLLSPKGIVIAIIVGIPAAFGVLDFWQPVAQYTYDEGKKIIENIVWPEENQKIKSIAILPKKLEFQEPTDEQGLEELPIGTELYLVSGTMTLG